MEKIIILTPAIARPEMHSIVLEGLINKFFKDIKIPIIWIINIDKDKNKTMHDKNIIKTNISQEFTKKNMLKYINKLKNITPIFNFSSISNFWEATKFLMKKSREFLNENTGILWFEDDWILVRDLNLQNIIDKYYTRNCYISLQFNELTFPPFIMGFNFYNKFLDMIDEITVDPRFPENDFIDPENAFRFSMYKILQNETISIYNFLVNYNEKCIDKLFSQKENMFLFSFGLNKSRKVNAFCNKNNKSFFITNNLNSNYKSKIEKINSEIPFKTKTVPGYDTTCFLKIYIISYETFKTMPISNNNIRIIRFGGNHLSRSNHGNFLDSGRIWKKFAYEINNINELNLKIDFFKNLCNESINNLNKNGLNLNYI